ncbi:Replication-associated recombination protein A [Piscirickettsia salmonis]|uniref:Replication-associated recombination protein A n=1 Tax=Piscirickettsia salmonis TaxID=1238 RepID=A0A1L6TBC2_PISSA|nr:replication-associated recombination protein A [Piscirickettsia salmonis]AKP73814.1 recombination factor protein RarA [Piscirickettsia salmonis LF-89 = ATCC VR-1361]ALB22620.1 sigma-54 interaction domain protein [Piscirickettsia salmonis]ALY02636.1 recombination factor protein RarA [Piscirickettsia salmonis]AMA42179.1 recombination factor protein RarA [Piscirickettsia salmonis]AOS34656.1 recombination factor protein RarA [Piscirickettsia salmonis]
MRDLFDDTLTTAPLAHRIRPKNLNEIIGQEHLTSGPLSSAHLLQGCPSLILWGPSGTGKTTLARLLAKHIHAEFIERSAIMAGLKEIRSAAEQARKNQQDNKQTLLFIDEIHRFSKSQQDAFLPFVEEGLFTLIGATTENPSFEINRALISRLHVYKLHTLDPSHLEQILERALHHPAGFGHYTIQFPENLRNKLIDYAAGDARRLLNGLEQLVQINYPSNTDAITHPVIQITAAHFNDFLGENIGHFDKGGDQFYDLISALHKSIRGSHPNAALFWLARMLHGGCDPLYIARRLVRTASEDIGNADPRALQLTLNAWDVIERLGSPEAELALAHAVTYLACAPKSNAVYSAFKSAMQDAKNHPGVQVPLHIRNAPTALMQDFNHGKNYRYAHDEPYSYAAGENYLPDGMQGHCYYYQPKESGLEKNIKSRLDFLSQLDHQYFANIKKQNKA